MKTNWQIKPISKCLQNIPKLGSLLRSDYLKDGKFPVIDQGQDFIAGYTNDESLVFTDCLPVVIFGDHTRALKFIDFPFAVGADGTKILKPSHEFDPRFFYYMLQSLDLGSRGYARHFKLLKEQEIPLPPLATQQKIVARLDELLGNIAQAKQLRQEAIADTEKILSQTLREIFEEGKEKGWEEKIIQDIAEVKGGKRLPKGKNLIDEKTNHPYLRVTDFKNGILNIDSVKYITENTFKDISRYTISSEDIFISIAGTIGLVCKIPVEFNEANLTENAAKITNIDKSISKDFLYWQLLTDRIQKEFNSRTIQTTISKLALFKISEQKILIPSLPEQNEIVTRLDTLSLKLRELRQLQTEQLEDLKKLEKAYLREAFNGELI
jgi:type I restriction enzyme S subunit